MSRFGYCESEHLAAHAARAARCKLIDCYLTSTSMGYLNDDYHIKWERNYPLKFLTMERSKEDKTTLQSATIITGLTNDAPKDVEKSIAERDAVESTNQPTKSKGFLPFLALVSIPDNAKDADRRLKLGLTSIISLAAMAAPLGSTILMRM